MVKRRLIPVVLMPNGVVVQSKGQGRWWKDNVCGEPSPYGEVRQGTPVGAR